MKMLIRGGSIAVGHGVEKGYADILAQTLPSQGIDVINRSRHQETSFEGIETFSQDIACFKPDVLLIHFGVDDASQYVYRSEFQENMVQMIKLAQRTFNPRIFLATSHAFDDLSDMDAVNIFYRSLRIVASDLKCELIPVHRYWAGYLEEQKLSNKDLTLPDQRYPNETGHQIIAKAVIIYLNKLAALTHLHRNKEG